MQKYIKRRIADTRLQWRMLFPISILMLNGVSTITPVGAATINVTANAPDIFNGVDGSCSLREAIVNINNALDSSPDCKATGADYGSGDTIQLPAGTYINSIPSTNENANADGDLNINKSVTIIGAGAATTVIDGGSIDRVLGIDSFARGITVKITGVTVRNGNATNGGGIMNRGKLTLNNTRINNNTGINGGGISNLGSLMIHNSVLSKNTAKSRGGAIDNEIFFSHPPVALIVTNSLITGNSGVNGGGIFNLAATADIINSTISGNLGSGIYNALISGDSDDRPISAATVINSTLSENTDGGIFSGIHPSLIVNLKNSIVAKNVSADCLSSVTTTLNDLDSDGSCGVAVTADPLLGPLANNGGITATQALLPGSPALGAGDTSTCTNAPVNNLDQRGKTRPQGTGCDIGAFELGPLPSIGLGINRSSFTTSDTITLTGSVTPGLTPALADVYVVLQLPDSTLLSMQPDGQFETVLTPLVSNILVPSFSGQIFDFTFTGAEPAGNYTWFAALTQPGTLNVIDVIVNTSFSFAP